MSIRCNYAIRDDFTIVKILNGKQYEKLEMD
jgi:hypothetical protein